MTDRKAKLRVALCVLEAHLLKGCLAAIDSVEIDGDRHIVLHISGPDVPSDAEFVYPMVSLTTQLVRV